MAFLLSNMLATCKIKSESDSESIAEPKTTPIPSTSTSSTTLTMTNGSDDYETEDLIYRLLNIHENLETIGADSLKPCEEVNGLFGALVEMCIETISEVVTNKVLNDHRIISILPSLHRLCGTAECHLESHWTKYISGSPSSTPEEVHNRLTQFPYYANYIALTRLELSALSSLLTPTCLPLQKFAFIGSGPLPLTSLCIYRTASIFIHPGQTTAGTFTETPKTENKTHVLNIDINPQAISQSSNLINILLRGPGTNHDIAGGGDSSGMTFQCSSATNPKLDLTSFDVVYLAALVGSTQAEKEDLLESVVSRMREGAYLVVRSAERLRRVLYAEFDPTSEKVRKCLDICLAVHPYNNVVNSVIIGKVRGRTAAEESQ